MFEGRPLWFLQSLELLELWMRKVPAMMLHDGFGIHCEIEFSYTFHLSLVH